MAPSATSPTDKGGVAALQGGNAEPQGGNAEPQEDHAAKDTARRYDAGAGHGTQVIVPDIFDKQTAVSPVPAGGQPAAEQAYDMAGSVRRSLAANPQMQSVRASFSGAEAARRKALADFGAVAVAGYAFTRQDSQVNRTGSQSLSLGQSTSTSTVSGLPTSRTVHSRIGTWQNLYQVQLQVTQPLFTGFQLLSTYQKAQLTEDYNKANIRSTELSLIKTVQQAFLTLLQARANVQSNRDSVARLVGQYKLAQAYYDEGLYPRLDMLQAEADLAAAEQTLLKSQNAVSTQTVLLNTLLNLPLDRESAFSGTLSYVPFPRRLAECLDQAYAQRPDLTMAVKTVQIAERDVTLAASPFYPQVQAQATVTRQGNLVDLEVRDRSGRTVPDSRQYGLSASLQAWDTGSTFFGVQAAREKVRKLQADLATLRLDVGTQVKTAYSSLEDAAKRISVARVAVVASKEGFRIAKDRYEERIGTSTDVLNAQSTLTTAETSLTQALTDYQSALAALYAAMGVDNPDLSPR